MSAGHYEGPLPGPGCESVQTESSRREGGEDRLLGTAGACWGGHDSQPDNPSHLGPFQVSGIIRSKRGGWKSRKKLGVHWVKYKWWLTTNGWFFIFDCWSETSRCPSSYLLRFLENHHITPYHQKGCCLTFILH